MRYLRGARELAEAIADATESVGHCERCRMLTDTPLCPICQSGNRDGALLCVVETQADVLALEQSIGYRGLYFVLMGHLSPLDGIGPDALGLDRLAVRLQSGEIGELILATNPTVEGEATAHYIAERLAPTGVTVTRLAHGVPVKFSQPGSAYTSRIYREGSVSARVPRRPSCAAA